MSRPARAAVVKALLDQHGRTYADELRIPIERNSPSPLFRVLCAALLMSARIRASVAVDAARAVADQGWTTAAKMAGSSWDDRAHILNRAGYARYDERTATMLGETAELLLDRYRGDLRRLRDEAGREPKAERRLLKACKGIGDIGVDIFFREVQTIWTELEPFADRRALASARRLRLPDDPRALRRLADGDMARLVAALVRVDLEDAHDDVLAAAR